MSSYSASNQPFDILLCNIWTNIFQAKRFFLIIWPLLFFATWTHYRKVERKKMGVLFSFCLIVVPVDITMSLKIRLGRSPLIHCQLYIALTNSLVILSQDYRYYPDSDPLLRTLLCRLITPKVISTRKYPLLGWQKLSFWVSILR